MIVKIKLNNKEERIASKYAALNKVSLAKSMKKTYFKKIEDEYDLAIANAALKAYKKDRTTYTLAEIKHELGI